jgi:hypothetical protein
MDRGTSVPLWREFMSGSLDRVGATHESPIEIVRRNGPHDIRLT